MGTAMSVAEDNNSISDVEDIQHSPDGAALMQANLGISGDEFLDHDDDDDDEWEDEPSSESEEDDMTDAQGNVFKPIAGRGCVHYSRGCRLVSPCCGLEFWCRFCHNEYYDSETQVANKHTLDRYHHKQVGGMLVLLHIIILGMPNQIMFSQ
jgi:hypothetical protein